MIEFIYKEPTLIETIKAMNRWNKLGYSTWIEGRGDSRIKLVIEDSKFTIVKGGQDEKRIKVNN